MEVQSSDIKLYGASDVHQILGIYKSELSYWIKTYRLLKPVEAACGPGTRYKFSLANILELAVIKEMLNYGFNLNTIKQLKQKLDHPVLEKDNYRPAHIQKAESKRLNIFEKTIEWIHKSPSYDAIFITIYRGKNKLHIAYQSVLFVDLGIEQDYGEKGIIYGKDEDDFINKVHMKIEIDLLNMGQDLFKKIGKE